MGGLAGDPHAGSPQGRATKAILLGYNERGCARAAYRKQDAVVRMEAGTTCA